jgi:hypothetical protein
MPIPPPPYLPYASHLRHISYPYHARHNTRHPASTRHLILICPRAFNSCRLQFCLFDSLQAPRTRHHYICWVHDGCIDKRSRHPAVVHFGTSLSEEKKDGRLSIGILVWQAKPAGKHLASCVSMLDPDRALNCRCANALCTSSMHATGCLVSSYAHHCELDWRWWLAEHTLRAGHARSEQCD